MEPQMKPSADATPERIWLQVKDEDGNVQMEITWCADKIYDTDVEYRRVLPGGK